MRISDWSSDVCSSDLCLGYGASINGTQCLDTSLPGLHIDLFHTLCCPDQPQKSFRLAQGVASFHQFQPRGCFVIIHMIQHDRQQSCIVLAFTGRLDMACNTWRIIRQTTHKGKTRSQALGLEPAEEQALAKGAPAVTAKGWVPVLFVSSSMPISTLRNYAVQLERVHGVMAFRGVPGDRKSTRLNSSH